MDAPTWVFASIAGVTVFHLFVLAYLRARRQDGAAGVAGPTGGGDSSGGDADEAGDDTVRCPQCGAENERRFQFCRRCVAELPGGSLMEGESGTSRPGIL